MAERCMPNSLRSIVYPPLPSDRSIRLLELKYDSSTRAIDGTLQTYNLDQAPSYFALSYTWDEPYVEHVFIKSARKIAARSRLILRLNGLKVEAGASLLNALEYIVRYPNSTPLWIDALCIDQQDLEERTQQVKIMGDIFLHAETVVAWLGHDRDGLFTFAWVVDEWAPPVLDFFEKEGRDPFLIMNEAQLESRGVPSWTYERIENAVAVFSTMLFFRRTWIAQELTLGKNIQMVCGDFVFSWANLQKLASLLVETSLGTVIHCVNHPLASSEFIPLLARFVDLRRRWRPLLIDRAAPRDNFGHLWRCFHASTETQRARVAILHLAQGARATFCSDKRDLVHANLGIAAPFLPDGADKYIEVTYEKSHEEIFTSVTASALQSLSNLTPLYYAQKDDIRTYYSHQAQKVPSWVIDFHIPSRRECLQVQVALAGDYLFSVWGASSTVSPNIVCDGHAVHVDGLKFNTVESISASSKEPMDAMNPMPLLRLCLPFLSYDDDTCRIEHLWRNECYNPVSHPRLQNTNELANGFKEVIRSAFATYAYLLGVQQGGDKTGALKWITTALNEFQAEVASGELYDVGGIEAMTNWTGAGFEDLDWETQQALRENEAACEAYQAASRAMRQTVGEHRMPFRTREGHLGKGTTCILPGDEVWLLQGADVPFVLRPAAAGYELIGECYLHGFMNGEIMHRKWDDIRHMQEISIV